MFKNVRYVIVRVSDVSKMVSFWRDNIGLKPSYVTSVWSEIPLENIVIALLHDEDASPKRTGVVFEVDGIREIVEKLKARGVKVSEISDIGSGLLAFFNDPEGNEYEIFQPR
ncbi:MAG: VOC family protein [Desulfurococcales archaeon]|nr:VOC family protein [Desulfurococcales archaeon]